MEKPIEKTKQIMADAIECGVIATHHLKTARQYAIAGLPWRGAISPNPNYFLHDAIRIVVASAMRKRSIVEVKSDVSYNIGFERRYRSLCVKYGIEIDEELLDICIIT